MRARLTALTCSAIALAAWGGLLSGCGGDGPEHEAAANESQQKSQVAESSGAQTVEACLRDNGATFATSTDEIDFLGRAEANGQAYGQGFFYDEVAKIVVNTLGQGKIEGRPPQWFVWFGQPTAEVDQEAASPVELIESKAPRTFVAYVLHPSPDLRQKTKACFD